MNFILMTRRFRLGHEFPYARLQRSFSHHVWTGAVIATRIIQRGPFTKDGWNVKFNVRFGHSFVETGGLIHRTHRTCW